MSHRLLPLVLLAALLSGCSFHPLGFVNLCDQSAQFGCLKTSTSPAWWLR